MNRSRRRQEGAVRLVGALLLALGVAGLGAARHTFAAATVTNCPTTEAALINDITTAGPGGTVILTCTSATTIPFDAAHGGTGLITISQDVTLDGSGAQGSVTFDGGGSSQLFVVNSGVSLSLIHLTLQNGSASNGGAIEDDGSLSIKDSTFSGNRATSLFGGAINTNFDTALSIADSTFSNNSSIDFGGAIFNDGMLSITASTFSVNSAANQGGAVDNNGGAVSSITNSTFSGNSASSGGAIFNDGTMTITDSSLSRNSASSGGAIFNISGIVPTPLSIGGSIIANSSSGGNCSGTISDNGYNLEDTSPSTCGLSAGQHDIVGRNPQLRSLADNGGPTQTMALLPNSPAIDANTCSFKDANGNTITTDQRGYPRPDNGETVCDIGAYESSSRGRAK